MSLDICAFNKHLRSWFISGTRVLLFFALMILPVNIIFAQEEYEGEDEATEVFWGDEEEEFYDEDLEYMEEEEYLDEDEYLDEYFEEDEYYEEGEEYEYGEEYYEEEEGEELSDVVLADVAKRMGYSLSISGASPGFVNHALTTYNNSPQVVYRIGLEFPLLLQVGGVRFRFGVEAGTFGFENYQPIGGKYSGTTILGIISFPAGPGQVKLGGGMIGSNFGFSGETSYGFALGNTLEIRVGVRSTTATNVTDTAGNELGNASWLDGLIVLGFNL